VPIIRDYRSKIASNSFTGKVNTRDFSALYCVKELNADVDIHLPLDSSIVLVFSELDNQRFEYLL